MFVTLTLFWQFYFVNFELLLYFFSMMHCTLNWISKIINDSAEECLYQLYQIIMNPLFLQNKELSDNWTRKKTQFFISQGCTTIKHCNAQHSDSSVWGNVKKHFDL